MYKKKIIDAQLNYKIKLLLLHDHKKNKKNPCRERNNFKIRNRKNTNKISYKLQQEQQKQKFR